MPKLRERPDQKVYNNLTQKLKSGMLLRGLNHKETASRCRMSYSTFNVRLAQPETWNLCELVKISEVLPVQGQGNGSDICQRGGKKPQQAPAVKRAALSTFDGITGFLHGLADAFA